MYSVPCVRGKYFNVTDDWPVMGPQHEDEAHINFPWQHYHIDWRFVPQHRFKPLGFNLSAPLMISDRINSDGFPTPVLRRRKMHRAMGEFNEVLVRAKWFYGLESAYADCKLKDGMVCPHRGIPLSGMHQEGDIVTCPGHGLRWNVVTGELVRQLKP